MFNNRLLQIEQLVEGVPELYSMRYTLRIPEEAECLSMLHWGPAKEKTKGKDDTTSEEHNSKKEEEEVETRESSSS